jgi:hypothetical protein
VDVRRIVVEQKSPNYLRWNELIGGQKAIHTVGDIKGQQYGTSVILNIEERYKNDKNFLSCGRLHGTSISPFVKMLLLLTALGTFPIYQTSPWKDATTRFLLQGPLHKDFSIRPAIPRPRNFTA